MKIFANIVTNEFVISVAYKKNKKLSPDWTLHDLFPESLNRKVGLSAIKKLLGIKRGVCTISSATNITNTISIAYCYLLAPQAGALVFTKLYSLRGITNPSSPQGCISCGILLSGT